MGRMRRREVVCLASVTFEKWIISFSTLLLFEPETFQNKVVPTSLSIYLFQNKVGTPLLRVPVVPGTLREEVPVLLSLVLYSVGERISDGG